MKIEKLMKRKRDDKVHNCDLIFFTRFNISGDYFKLNKKVIECNLQLEKYIQNPLPRYSKHNDRVSCLITHRINNFNLRGWKRDNTDDSYSFEGVAKDCVGLVKDTIWKDKFEYSLLPISSETNNPIQFKKQIDVFFKLQELNNNPESEIVNLFLTYATEIIQDVIIVDKSFDIQNERQTYNWGNPQRVKETLLNFHAGLDETQTNKFVSYMSFDKIDDEFKITEAFAEKEKEYSKLEDIHINFNLSKDIELSLTSELDETKEDLIERAKQVVVRELTSTMLRDTFNTDNLSVVNSNLITGGK